MSAANVNSHCLVRFSDDWHRLALLKMRQLQDDGMTCAEIVLEHPVKGTAHIDRWGKVTWDDKQGHEVKKIEAYQQRVIEEKQVLDEKIEKLSAFIGTERYCALPEAEQVRMDRQLIAMGEYSAILGERIAAF